MTCCSIPQSEETRAELSQIAWVPRQVSVSPSANAPPSYRSGTIDYFATSKQTCNGNRPRYIVRHSQVHSAGYFPRLATGPEHSSMGARVGWCGPYTSHNQTQTTLDGQTVAQYGDSSRYQHSS